MKKTRLVRVSCTHVYFEDLSVRVLDGGIIALYPHVLHKLGCRSKRISMFGSQGRVEGVELRQEHTC